MNKGLLTVYQALASVGSLLNPFAMGGSRYQGKTPGMPHSKHYREVRPHIPNDGHWHMRFHRDRH